MLERVGEHDGQQGFDLPAHDRRGHGLQDVVDECGRDLGYAGIGPPLEIAPGGLPDNQRFFRIVARGTLGLVELREGAATSCGRLPVTVALNLLACSMRSKCRTDWRPVRSRNMT
jgi:hypothetical protein